MKLEQEFIGELLGLFAHDLRNPLSAMQSNAGFLESLEHSDPDAADAIYDLLVACDSLVHIIDNLDVFSRELRGASPMPNLPSDWNMPSRSGEQRPLSAHDLRELIARQNSEGIALSELVQKSVEKSKLLAKSHGVEVQVRLPEALLGERLVNQGEGLSRALMSLLRNSLQHAPSGSLVEISAQLSEGRVELHVSDAGAPIPRDVEALAFSLAGQVGLKSSGAGRYGRGLGLYVAQRCAETSGAQVKLGQGEGHSFVLSCSRASLETAEG